MNQQQDPGAIEADRREEEARQTGGTTGAASMTGGNLTGPDSPAGLDAARSATEPAEPAEPIAPDAGSPGGMGGVHAQGGTRTNRPAGGVSPVQDRDGA